MLTRVLLSYYHVPLSSGILEVLVSGRSVHTLKDGSFFGEQAFRTSVEGENGTPRADMSGTDSVVSFKSARSSRTATVKCTTRCQLLVLHQAEFFRILQVRG